jgi:hypothetical protein
MILIDTLHTSFPNFAAAREALVKLFQQEHSADSQYVAIALGASPVMLLNVTPDASAVLAVANGFRRSISTARWEGSPRRWKDSAAV